jgi:S1-C subfamily serine protease
MRRCVLSLSLLVSITITLPAQSQSLTYQSNKDLKFGDFLDGVTRAYIGLPEKKMEFIKNNPNSIDAMFLQAIKKWLEELKFVQIKWGEPNAIPTPKSFCDLAIVVPQWTNNEYTYSNIKITFLSCRQDVFTLTLKGDISYSQQTTYEEQLYQRLSSAYSYERSEGREYLRLKLPRNSTQWKEASLKSYFLNSKIDAIEGIYERTSRTEQMSKYKVGIVRSSDGYEVIYLNGAENSEDWDEGEIKARLTETATPLMYKAKWYMANKRINEDPFITFERGKMNEVFPDEENGTYIKLFPTSSQSIPMPSKSSGTGFALSSQGLIVTNQHVVDQSESIKVRGLLGDFSKSYSAKVILEDKNNDLAIIQIDDPSFKTLGKIPFRIDFKTKEVGTSIYLLGYPLRSTMGDEVKLTTGIISSRTGFQGDLTTYQVSAPIQPGSSGGPMFDTEGNLTGIVNAKHSKAENVSYVIKVPYLKSMVESLPFSVMLNSNSTIVSKPLPEQVKLIKNFVYIIEIN